MSCQSGARSVAHGIQHWTKAQRSSLLSGRRGAGRPGIAVCVPPPQVPLSPENARDVSVPQPG